MYTSEDRDKWSERTFWQRQETGAADFLHAYWMGRHYRFVAR